MQANAQVEIAGAACARLAFASDADTRPVADAGRNPHIHGARMPVVFDREPPGGTAKGILERQVECFLDVSAFAGPSLATAAAASIWLGSTEKGLEEVRERIVGPEHLADFVFGHARGALAGRLADAQECPTERLYRESRPDRSAAAVRARQRALPWWLRVEPPAPFTVRVVAGGAPVLSAR